MVARTRPARRAPHAGDEARRRRRAASKPSSAAGYEVAHHGEGRWNGVAIASRVGIADVVSNFGEPRRTPATTDVGDDEPLAEARMIAAMCGGVRVVSLYAPNGRVGELAVLRSQAASGTSGSPAGWPSADPAKPLAAGRRLQRRAHRRGRLGSGRLPRRHARLASRSAGLSRGSAIGASPTRTASTIPSPGATPGGTTAPATSTRTSACGSTTCWSRRPSPGGRSAPRSIARPARANRSRRTTPRSWSTSTSRGHHSTRAGPAPRAACGVNAARAHPWSTETRHQSRGHPLRASKIARGLRTSIWSICSSDTPALRSAGRMSSEMWL